MSKANVSMSPDIDRLVLVQRGANGDARVVADVDAGLEGRRGRSYPVYVIRRDGGGEGRISVGGSRKKQSKALRPVEKLTRKSTSRMIRFLQDYVYLHERSNQRKRNGWLRDYSKNLRKAFKRLRD